MSFERGVLGLAVLVMLAAFWMSAVGGCRYEIVRYERGGEQVRIVVDRLREIEGGSALEGDWRARGAWSRSQRFIPLEMESREGSLARTSMGNIDTDEIAALRQQAGDANEESPAFEMNRDSGSLVFEGWQGREVGAGRFVFRVNDGYREELGQVVAEQADAYDMLELALADVRLEYARQMKTAFGASLSLDDLVRLGRYHIRPEYAKGMREVGYGWSADDIIKLSRYHIKVEFARSFKSSGYTFGVDDLIKVSRYHLDAGDFTAFRDAGYDFDIDTMIKADRYHINADEAKAFRDAGFDYDVDELIKLGRYHIRASEAACWKKAGYDYSIEEMIKADRYHITAAEAGRYKEAGGKWSLDDMIKLERYHVDAEYMEAMSEAGYKFLVDEYVNLKRWNVSTEFATALANPEGRNYSADDLVEFKRKGLTVETIRRIRASGK